MNSESNREKTIAQAAMHFLASVPQQERAEYQQEINKFVRWYGSERPLSELAAREVAGYAKGMEGSPVNATNKLTPVKTFLTYARKEGLIRQNLAIHLRVKKGTPKKRYHAKEAAEVITLTPEGYRELKEELSLLKEERPRIAEDIRRAAADKDFSENAPLDAAKDHQGMVEGRIRHLETILKSAVIKTENRDSSGVTLGSTVILEDLSSKEELRYTLVNPREASPSRGKLSIDSPTGKALLNRQQGEAIEVAAPAGTLRYRIARIEE